MRPRVYLYAVMALVVSWSCDTPTEPSLTRPALPPLTSAVTGAAQAALGADGFFRIAADTAFGADSLISPARAHVLLQSALQRRNYPFVIWSRGDAYVELSWPDIRFCGPPRMNRAWTLPITDSVTLSTRWTYGPWYSATVCDPDGNVRGTMGVTALATSLGRSDSALTAVLDRYAGLDRYSAPDDWDPLFTAEQAAVLAFVLTGQRVISVPQPVAIFGSRSLAFRYRVDLEAPVRYRETNTGREDSTRSLIVRYAPRAAMLAIVDATTTEPPTYDGFDFPASDTGSPRRVVLTLADTARRRLLPVVIVP